MFGKKQTLMLMLFQNVNHGTNPKAEKQKSFPRYSPIDLLKTSSVIPHPSIFSILMLKLQNELQAIGAVQLRRIDILN